jgi:hypothetical protein
MKCLAVGDVRGWAGEEEARGEEDKATVLIG